MFNTDDMTTPQQIVATVITIVGTYTVVSAADKIMMRVCDARLRRKAKNVKTVEQTV